MTTQPDSPSTYRRPTDVIYVIVGVVILLVSTLILLATRGYFEAADFQLFRAINDLPDWLSLVLRGIMQLGALAAVPVLALVALRLHSRALARNFVAGGIVAWFAAKLVKTLVSRGRPGDLLDAVIFRGGDPSGLGFPSGHTTIAFTLATIVTPYLERRSRLLVWGLASLVAFARIYVGAHFPIDIVGGIALGLVIGALTNLLLGVQTASVSLDTIRRAFNEYGIDITELQPVTDDARGSVPYFAQAADGQAYFVKLIGSEQRNADFLFKVWRTLLLKSGAGSAPYLTPKQQVEHEAYLNLLARDHEVRSPEIAFTHLLEDGFAILAQKRVTGRTLTEAGEAELPDSLLEEIWQQVARLHEARIYHGDLRLANILVDEEGQPWMIDFGFAAGGAEEEHLMQDSAQLLASLAPVVGVERAVAAAMKSIPQEELIKTVPHLQPLALSSATRADLKEHDFLDELKEELAEQSGVEPPEDESVLRFEPRSIFWVLGLGIGIYLLFPQIGELSSLIEVWRHIRPLWLVAALGGSLLAYVMATVAQEGALKERISPWLTFLAHFAATFANRFGPRGIGGAYVLEQFIEKAGRSRREAVTAVTVKTAAGAIVHVLLVIAALALTGRTWSTLFGDIQPWQIALAVAVIGVLLIFLLRSPDRAHKAWNGIKDSLAELKQTLQEPVKALELFGGSLGTTLSYIGTLALCLWAVGGEISIFSIAAAYLIGEIIGSASPTPGGLGVLEGAFVAGLVAFGLPSEQAVAGVLTYRLLTFWLPILPGLAAFRYMQGRDLL